jgi:hypothetical protein
VYLIALIRTPVTTWSGLHKLLQGTQPRLPYRR